MATFLGQIFTGLEKAAQILAQEARFRGTSKPYQGSVLVSRKSLHNLLELVLGDDFQWDSEEEWTAQESEASRKEGWDLFGVNTNHGVVLEIQRVDCPEDGSEAVFDDDVDAAKYVMGRAKQGSRRHAIALRLSVESQWLRD